MASNERKRAASDTTSDDEAPDTKKQCRPAPSETSNAEVGEGDVPMAGSSTIVQNSIMPTVSAPQPDSNTASAPSVATTSTHGFFGPLPQELEDLIFQFAYHRDPAMKFTTSSSWARQEEQKRRSTRTYVALPFPGYFVSQWLVSKRYLIAAASVWFGSEPFDFAPGQHPRRPGAQFISSYDFSDLGLFHDFVIVVKDDFSSVMRYPSKCKRLTELTLLMYEEWDSGARRGIRKCAWQEPFNAADFDNMLKRSDLLELRGFKSLKVEYTPPRPRFAPWHTGKTDEEQAILAANTRDLEKLLGKFALRPKFPTPVETETAPRPLYSGSKVFWMQPMEDEKTAKAKEDVKRLERLESALESGELTLSKKMRKDIGWEASMLYTVVSDQGDALKEAEFPFGGDVKACEVSRCAAVGTNGIENPHSAFALQPNTCHLLELPVELQVKIFDIAFPVQPDFRIISKSSWDSKENEEYLTTRECVPRPFAHYKRPMWHYQISDNEIAALLDESPLLRLRGLETFSMTPPSIRHAKTDQAKQLLKTNTECIEQYLKQTLLLSKDSRYIDEFSNAAYLYAGSRVRWIRAPVIEKSIDLPSSSDERPTKLSEKPSSHAVSSTTSAEDWQVSTVDKSRQCIAKTTQPPVTRMRPKYVSRPPQTEPISKQSAMSEQWTFAEAVANLELLRDMMAREGRKHVDNAIAEDFPPIEDHVQWLLKRNEGTSTD
nr:hypothetical protein B0A51_04804 [Rachicladosporium sp. CCFEE 5018]